MAVLLIIIIGNTIIYGMVHWFITSDKIEEMGGANVPNVCGLGMCCMVIELGCLLNAVGDVEQFPSAASKMAPIFFAFVTALPWLRIYIRLVSDMMDNMTDFAVGTNAVAKEIVNLKAAYALIKNGEFDDAIRELASVRRQYPDSAKPIFVLASIAHSRQDREGEEQYYRDIYLNDRFLAEARINAAASLLELLEGDDERNFELSNLKHAIAVMKADDQASVPITPKEDDSRVPARELDLNQARRFVSRGEIDKAVPLFKSCIAAKPDYAKTYFELVSLYEREGRFDDAIVWLQNAIAHFREDDIPWGNAMLRLAGLRETAEHDIPGAIYLLESVAERLKQVQQGKLAKTRLRDIKEGYTP